MVIAVAYGWAAHQMSWFPSNLLHKAYSGYQSLRPNFTEDLPWGYRYTSEIPALEKVEVEQEKIQEGINLIGCMGEANTLQVRLENLSGTLLNEWRLNWFELWPDAKHLPEHIEPKSEPGTFIHGMVLLPNGNLVFNFEYCGMLCVDPEGEVVWKLDYSSHHSLSLSADGHLWACGLKFEENEDAIDEGCALRERQTLIEVSSEGVLLNEWLIEDLLVQSELAGYLHLMPRKCGGAHLLHLNDVEPIEDAVCDSSSWFQKGDVLFSLRNVNAVFVFNRFSQEVRKAVAGNFIAQHDPDVYNGSSITVYDNGNAANESSELKSRIVQVDLSTGEARTVFEGSGELPFYSEKLGKHQWLKNGNLLITASQQGRALEIDPRGRLVWWYENKLSKGLSGYLIEVQRLPESYALPFQ